MAIEVSKCAEMERRQRTKKIGNWQSELGNALGMNAKWKAG
jgi:hypothetical protein